MAAGFTLIELLIVVVIIGILASIAIPKFHNSKEQAYIAAMREDVRNLATAEEAYYDDNSGIYASTTAQLGTNYKASAGVTYTVSSATGTGWAATATHTGLVGAPISGCHVAIGAGVTTATNNEGTPYCP